MQNSLIALALASLAVLPAAHAQTTAQADPTTHRLVVTLKPQAKASASTLKLTAAVSGPTTKVLTPLHSLASGAVVYDMGASVSLQQAQDIARRIQSDPAVQSAEPDVRVRRLFTPQDPYFYSQWGLFTSSTEPGPQGAMNAIALWRRTLGSNTKVAVLDTGLVQHPELVGRIIPGYDFISDAKTAGDGNGRDSDPTDTGDFCTDDKGNVTETSSWHGTMVAGIIGAASDTQSITGVAPQSKLLNVRVLGRCGGWLSDVADAVRWTAGLEVPGVPTSTHGPLVMNLSLATDPGLGCPSYMQSAITAAVEAGSIVVAAAGNDGKNGLGAPASCENVVAVAAHTGNADLAAYSNYAPGVVVSGPAGGTCRKDVAKCFSYPAATIGVTGRTEFESYSGAVYMAGTSAASPFVAAVLGMLRELRPTLTSDQAISLLRNASRPFPGSSFCFENAQCGFGMLDAEMLLGAMEAEYIPTVALASNRVKALKGESVRLTATASSKVQGTSFTYAWAQKSGPSVTLSGSGSSVSFVSPDAKGSVVVEVQVTDGTGRTANAQTSVAVTNGQAPKVQRVTAQAAVAGEPWSLTPSVTDADNDFDRLVLVQGPPEMVASSTKLEWPAAVKGSYDVRFVAVDKDGLESPEQAFTLTVAASADGTDPNNGDDGGGAMGGLGLLMLAAAFALKRWARQAAPQA